MSPFAVLCGDLFLRRNLGVVYQIAQLWTVRKTLPGGIGWALFGLAVLFLLRAVQFGLWPQPHILPQRLREMPSMTYQYAVRHRHPQFLRAAWLRACATLSLSAVFIYCGMRQMMHEQPSLLSSKMLARDVWAVAFVALVPGGVWLYIKAVELRERFVAAREERLRHQIY